MITETLHLWLADLQAAKQRYLRELETLPEGRLYCVHESNGRTRYYHSILDDLDERKLKGVGRNPTLKRELARKAYVTQAIKILDKDMSLLSRFITRWQPCSTQDIIASLPKSLRDIPAEEFLSKKLDATLEKLFANDEDRIQAHKTWGQKDYARSKRYPEQLVITTSFGLKVRSKAEALIAENLHDRGIPFRYEQNILVGAAVFAPDFTFEAADGSEFYLEFCGMMDNPEYVQSFLRKRTQYELANIVPWRNIIYLYTTGNTLNMQQVNSVIETQVMEWL